jgi:hypothetical protein
MLKVAQISRGAWHLAGTGSLPTALSNAKLERYGFFTSIGSSGSLTRGLQPPDAENRTSGGVRG